MCKLPDCPLYRHPALVIGSCRFGRGVFATEDLPADTILEECPHLRIPKSDCSGIMDDYVYGMAEDDGSTPDEEIYSFPLGFGSLFNHADRHNTAYWHDTDRDVIVFHTIRKVAAGEQLFINYGDAWWETRGLAPEKDDQRPAASGGSLRRGGQ